MQKTLLIITLFLLTACQQNQKLNEFYDYEEGLTYAKKHNKNILLIFDRWGTSNPKYSRHLTTPKIQKIIQDDILISLMVDDNAILKDTLTVGAYNRSIQKKYNFFEVPASIIIDKNENILHGPKGYLPPKEFTVFISKLNK